MYPCFYMDFFSHCACCLCLLNLDLFLAIFSHCKVLFWKGHNFWLVLRVRTQIARAPLDLIACRLVVLIIRMCRSFTCCSQTEYLSSLFRILQFVTCLLAFPLLLLHRYSHHASLVALKMVCCYLFVF